jgi:hypothetical protein
MPAASTFDPPREGRNRRGLSALTPAKMRALLLIAIVVVALVIAAMATGFLKIWGTGGESPKITASNNSITARPGKPPEFDIETGSVKVGSTQATVNVPSIEIRKAGPKPSAAATNKAM